MNLNKLKNQKGLTGIDVVIAISIIATTTVAILALFVNIVSSSRKSTRTSSATRIATTILSNIDSMYYADVEKELYRINSYWNETSNGIYASGLSKVFDTNIIDGYKVVFYVDEITNTLDKGFSEDAGALWNCPLVIEIKVQVTYGNREKVELKTVKKREIVDECNPPVISELIGAEYNCGVALGLHNPGRKVIKSTNQIQPIEWSNDLNAYVKSSESSRNWYRYSLKEWAKVVVAEPDIMPKLFDSNTGAFKPDKLRNDDGDLQASVYTWIPRCGTISSAGGVNEFAFAYSGSDDAIQLFSMQVNGNDDGTNKRDFFYYGVKKYDGLNVIGKKIGINKDLFPDGKTGAWIELVSGEIGAYYSNSNVNIYGYNIKTAVESTNIYNSVYGPPIGHVSTDY